MTLPRGDVVEISALPSHGGIEETLSCRSLCRRWGCHRTPGWQAVHYRPGRFVRLLKTDSGQVARDSAASASRDRRCLAIPRR